MRILIGNHIDADLLWQSDQRTFTQRMVWFAQNGDVLVLPAEPDRCFVEHVTSLTGVDADTLTFLVAPCGRYEGKLLDPQALLDEDLLAPIAKVADDIEEVCCFWPSVEVARFAEKLGVSERLPGAAFFAQGGVELANNKASFRALAAAYEVPIADGAVCRTIDDAQLAIERLIERYGMVLVKQAHNHAGLGNELLVIADRSSHDYAGARHMRRIEATAGSVREYLQERWAWASASGRYAVVVEQFKPNCRTIYAEFFAADDGVTHTESGELLYRERRLVAELAPVRDIGDEVRGQLARAGARLAEVYRSLGYRGYLSADAIVDGNGDFIFTEMNARVGGSPHIYSAIGHHVVDMWRSPERTVIQYRTGAHWNVPSLEEFLAAVKQLGYSYDREARKGVVVAIPPLPGCANGVFLFCIVYEAEHEHAEIYAALDALFGGMCDAA